MADIIDEVRDALDRNGWSQAELARRLEPDSPNYAQTIGRWLSGKTTPETPNTVRLALRQIERPAIPDIERAACTILASSARHIVRRSLREWVERIVSDPEYTARLDEPTNAAVRGRRPFEGHGLTELRPSDLMLDEAILLLAAAVASFRRDGRPEGDRTDGIGFGLTITTSLAAAVADHAANLHQLYGVAMQEIEDAARP